MADTAFETMVAERPRDDAGAADGRRMRAERSRKCIVDALITLIRNREVMRSAERGSEEAKVGLRTGCRHGEDMDSLHQEGGDQSDAQVMPLVQQPFVATDWCGKLMEMIDRRAQAFEWVMPFKIHANARLLQSDFLQDKHRCSVENDIERLRAIVPARVQQDEALFNAIVASLSLDVWRRLRRDQKCTPDEAKAAMQRMVGALLSAA